MVHVEVDEQAISGEQVVPFSKYPPGHVAQVVVELLVQVRQGGLHFSAQVLDNVKTLLSLQWIHMPEKQVLQNFGQIVQEVIAPPVNTGSNPSPQL